jgi:hypothetical protein
VCKFGIQDSLGFGILIENSLANIDLPTKLKIGVSGCQFCYAESFVRDIGLIGKKNGWTIIFGSHSGNRPRTGDIIGTDLALEDALELLKRCIDYYCANGRKKERASRFINVLVLKFFNKPSSDSFSPLRVFEQLFVFLVLDNILVLSSATKETLKSGSVIWIHQHPIKKRTNNHYPKRIWCRFILF